MSRNLLTLLAAGVAAATLSACSGNAQSGCTQPPIVSYPTPGMVSPSRGATGVSPALRAIVFSSTQSQIVGVLTLKGGGTTITLNPQPVANSGGLLDFSAPIPTALAPSTTYSITYTLQYPAGCQAAPIVNTTYVGSFTTSS